MALWLVHRMVIVNVNVRSLVKVKVKVEKEGASWQRPAHNLLENKRSVMLVLVV